jgi:hypothetical protein
MKRIKSFAKWIGLALFLNLLLIQFIQPARTAPAVAPGHDLRTSPQAPGPQAAAALQAACYDCHSSETKWPWYGHVAPVSWWLADHIKDARERLNFSDWPTDNPRLLKKKLHQISEDVTEGEMPLKSYTWMHPAARLTAEEKNHITDWADQEADKIIVPASAAEAGK